MKLKGSEHTVTTKTKLLNIKVQNNVEKAIHFEY